MDRIIIINAAQEGYESNVNELNEILEEGFLIKERQIFGETIFLFVLTDEQ